jgi:hypothetical protein
MFVFAKENRIVQVHEWASLMHSGRRFSAWVTPRENEQKEEGSGETILALMIYDLLALLRKRKGKK